MTFADSYTNKKLLSRYPFTDLEQARTHYHNIVVEKLLGISKWAGESTPLENTFISCVLVRAKSLAGLFCLAHRNTQVNRSKSETLGLGVSKPIPDRTVLCFEMSAKYSNSVSFSLYWRRFSHHNPFPLASFDDIASPEISGSLGRTLTWW